MLLEPPIDKLIKQVGNPYKLAVLAGKRAKFLQRTLTEEELNKIPEVSRAVQEIYDGKVVAEEDVTKEMNNKE